MRRAGASVAWRGGRAACASGGDGAGGPVATARERSLRNYRLFAARDPRDLPDSIRTKRGEGAELLRLMARPVRGVGRSGQISGQT